MKRGKCITNSLARGNSYPVLSCREDARKRHINSSEAAWSTSVTIILFKTVRTFVKRELGAHHTCSALTAGFHKSDIHSSSVSRGIYSILPTCNAIARAITTQINQNRTLPNIIPYSKKEPNDLLIVPHLGHIFRLSGYVITEHLRIWVAQSRIIDEPLQTPWWTWGISATSVRIASTYSRECAPKIWNWNVSRGTFQKY